MQLFSPLASGSVKNPFQINVASVDYNLSCLFKIDGYPVADIRLHLPKPPFRLCRMSDQHSRLQ